MARGKGWSDVTDDLRGERFLVTGAMGCIGAWTLRHLVRAGAGVVAADVTTEPSRPRLIMRDDELAQVRFERLDVSDLDALLACVARERITRIVHLAGVLIPGCVANPPLGARVNVEGTINILETVRRSDGRIRGVAYASSLAVLGETDLYPERPIGDDVLLRPHTLYGVYKMAGEHAARLYWETWHVPSIGLRPSVVYGVGRDTGLTADATLAIVAAVAGRPFRFRFSGALGMQYAPDVAEIFVRAAMSGHQGAPALNIRGVVTTVEQVVAAIDDAVPGARELIETPSDARISAADVSDAGLRSVIGNVPDTPLERGIAETVAMLRPLLARGLVQPPPVPQRGA